MCDSCHIAIAVFLIILISFQDFIFQHHININSLLLCVCVWVNKTFF